MSRAIASLTSVVSVSAIMLLPSSTIPQAVCFQRFLRVGIGPFQRIGTRPVAGAAVRGQWRLSESGSNYRRRVVQRVPPFLDGNWAGEEDRVENHLPCIALRPTDQKHRGDVIPPVNAIPRRVR